MRAREVRELLNNKVDPVVLKVLVSLAEENSIRKKELSMLAEGMDRLSQMIVNMTTIASNMTKKIDELKRIRFREDGDS